MRHRKSFNHLGRTSAHRKAMLSNMAASLILHKRINTTLAKAKELRTYVEPLITRAKEDSTHNRRIVFAELQNKEAVNELFRDVVVKIGERPGGYTRILKTGTRLGDNAEMCMMELVDYNENMLQDTDTKKKSTRRRRSRKKSTEEAKMVNSKPQETKKQEKEEEEAKTLEETTEVVDNNESVEETSSPKTEETTTNKKLQDEVKQSEEIVEDEKEVAAKKKEKEVEEKNKDSEK